MQRVAAYCRVSTEKDDQTHSLESQKRFFTEYIQRNPGWQLAALYVDEGITGTSTKKRTAFNRMLADAQAHRFDLILTKEISRFARNTLDSILYTRRLKELGIGVIFMNDNINTLDADAELRLTILSSIAQEESRKTSDRVKWGQKRRMEQGVVFGRDLLGYDVRGGKLYINEAGARVVRLIFHKFVHEDKGAHTIAHELREAGIATAKYMKQWSSTAVLRVLRNEKYCGDLIQKKTYTPNYLNHEKKPNHGAEERVVLRNHHPPIVSRQLFEQAGQKLARRAPTKQQRAKHSNRYCFSGKVKCGLCGCSYVPRSKKRQDGSLYKAWRCYQAAMHGGKKTDTAGNVLGCNGRSIREDDLRLVLQQAVKSLGLEKQAALQSLSKLVAKVLQMQPKEQSPVRMREGLRLLEEKRQLLLELYLNREIGKEDFQRMAAKHAGELQALQKQLAEAEHALGCTPSMQLEQAAESIRALACGEQWDDTFYRYILDTIAVEQKDALTVRLCLLPQHWRFTVCDE